MKKIPLLTIIIVIGWCVSALKAQTTALINLTFGTERSSVIPGFNEIDILVSAGAGYTTDDAIYTPNTTNPDGSWTGINFRFTQSGPLPFVNTEFTVSYPLSGVTGGQVTNVTGGGCYVGQPAFNITITRGSPAPDADGTPTVIATLRYPNTHPGETLIVRNTTIASCASRESYWGNQHATNAGVRLLAAGNSVTLPIELLKFEARTNKCDVSLYWETATEKNFGYYQIEASKDGRDFKAIAQQKPQSPNSSEKRVYKYQIPPAYEDSYFRLKAVDLDGSYEYSPVVYAKAPCESKQFDIQLYPNPNYTSELMVELNSPEVVENVRLLLLDALGQTIRVQKIDEVQVGSNKIPIETDDLPTGTYYIRIIGINQLSEPLKFIRSNF